MHPAAKANDEIRAPPPPTKKKTTQIRISSAPSHVNVQMEL